MVVKLRLARFGKRNAPVYNIVVAQARSARNSKPMEVIGGWASHMNGKHQLTCYSNAGTYDPKPHPSPDGKGKPFKDIQLDVARAKYWLGVGAQPSDPV